MTDNMDAERSQPDERLLAELKKTKDALFGVGVIRDANPELAELLAQCPVHQGTLSDHFGVVGPERLLYGDVPQVCVLGYNEVDQVFRDTERFTAHWYDPSFGPSFGRTILAMDPPEHTRYRQLLQGAFTRQEMDRWEREFVRDIVSDALDLIAPRGRADMVADFAVHYPIRVIVAACGLPQEDVPQFLEWGTQQTNVAIPPEDRAKVAEEFGEYVRGVIEERRARPAPAGPPDLVTYLLNAKFRKNDAGQERLTDEEIVSFVRFLVPAGATTTYRQLCNLLFGLLSNPDQLEAVRADRSLIPRAIEEGLRWEPPLTSFGRTALVDTEIAGVAVAAGTPVNLIVGAADRDPSRWTNPHEFNISRRPRPHLGFGTGNHLCLGIHAARMELRVALELVFDRLPGIALDPDAEDVFIGGLYGRAPEVLPVVFEPT